VRPTYLRHYPLGSLAAHLLGNLGSISEEQLAEPQYRKYSAGDVVGQAGVESTYDRWLRGVDGSLRVEVDVAGRPKRVVAGGSLAQPGNNLVLSLDADVQRVAEGAILYGIQAAHLNDAPSADAGAAVVLDAHSGEVIAMASYPTFDPEEWVGGISAKDLRRLTRPAANNPLLNRADQGTYAIGSTFKAVDAVAGLQEGEIAPGTIFSCTGVYKPPGATDKQTWPCWYPTGHGAVDLVRALTESCDIFFYNVGMRFYARDDAPLQEWAMRMGFGHTTGIDIPFEAKGVVPTRQWREQTYKTAIDKLWKPGDSINLSIGQGNLLATPLQTAVAYAAIANGGEVVRPHLGVKIVDSGGNLVQRIDHPQSKKLDILPQNLAVVQQGLRMAASSPAGTSQAVFGGYKIPVAGKTGTSEVLVDGHPFDFSWYASYAPADDPKYVVVVMIEKGGHGGSAAAPAAKVIYDELFHVKSARATGTTNSD
jgi:penicillin-binding protein 2